MRMILAALLLFVGVPVSGQDIAGSTNVGIPANAFILTDQAACPSGWTEVTAYQGFALWAQAASGTAGATLGTGRATNTTDSSYTPAGTNGTSAVTVTGSNNVVGTAPTAIALTSANGGTAAAQTFTGTAAATMRSTVVPSASFRICKRA